MKTYKLNQADELVKSMTKDMQQAAVRALLSAGHRVVERIVTSIIPNTDPQPVDRGVYRAAWRVRQTPGKLEVVVTNDSPHAGFIEEGVKAGRVKISRKMIDALTEWVLRKGIVQKARGDDGIQRKRRSPTKADRTKARGIAWAIAKRMKQRGIFNEGKGLKILERALAGIDRVIKGEFERELANK